MSWNTNIIKNKGCDYFLHARQLQIDSSSKDASPLKSGNGLLMVSNANEIHFPPQWEFWIDECLVNYLVIHVLLAES